MVRSSHLLKQLKNRVELGLKKKFLLRVGNQKMHKAISSNLLLSPFQLDVTSEMKAQQKMTEVRPHS